MSWAKYADDHTKQIIARPGPVISATMIFAFIAGERVTELMEKPHLNRYDLIFTAVFVFLPIWWSYFVVRALRELRDRRSTFQGQ